MANASVASDLAGFAQQFIVLWAEANEIVFSSAAQRV
jgi:hypothetical protein